LIVVQYVVVTNGAQRVSEVAARFTLDSMPGQQMSIDADLNMGFIDQAEAQRRRKNIEKEAAFYGAMDGASKFVKGDAIAGILILLINIIGGLVIGVMQHKLPWAQAVQTYTLLTIVLSMLRQAIGMPETPPNPVLIGLALFFTLFTMSPVLQSLNEHAFQPFMNGALGMEAAYGKGMAPLRDFMVRQTREQDLALMIELSKASLPRSIEEVGNVQLIPAFMLSELRAAFQIGFVIFLPFLLIDLVVSSVLMALGMMMLPPATVALPLKVLMFILVDGWGLVLKALVGSFH
jgi:flagellar biosynthetic protein FliP